jgi:antitoxin MazE
VRRILAQPQSYVLVGKDVMGYTFGPYINEGFMQVAKWGNSLAVRLPKQLVERLGLKAGDRVELTAIEPSVLAIAKDPAREAALDRMRQRRWQLPEGYRFDRGAD